MCQYGERGSIGNAKLAIDVVQVDLHGPLGESKPLRYFLVGQTFGYDPDDLAFTRSERVKRDGVLPWVIFLRAAAWLPSQPTALANVPGKSRLICSLTRAF